MLRTRVIPCLLLRGRGLVKTVKFGDPTYVGCPINAVKIFNEREVDELIFLDILAGKENKRPSFGIISEIATECFMPFCYGGGIRSFEDIQTIFALGAEKIAINSHAIDNPDFVREASNKFGSQSIVISIDVKKNVFGKHEVFTHVKNRNTNLDPVEFAVQMERMGAGELLLNSVDRDGTMQGYDIDLLREVCPAIGIPVIACGGARKLEDFTEAVHRGGASAVAAGSIFLFYGKHRAVLIQYPTQSDLTKVL